MPLSDHEQRMLDEIESALYAEDPKFASSVRGGALRTPTTRRRVQGMTLFVVGLVLLVSGIPFYATTVNPAFLILSVLGFVVMFGGAVFAVTGNHAAAGRDGAARAGGSAQRRVKGGGGTFASRMEDRFRRRFEP
ncbi:hypothetical protein AWC18_15245 [Mycolicibacter nonchromogenicus]|uniref:DUF3040 domain-containing protein n=1 Tax=Mycolicibacter nonchromogenicus TaxID=1782 RepID=A0A1X1Z671_MYCNO|nr:DUF3040 domain-containing protein [Mycolicibacter nonchromogenicus]OBI03219.1 hypothetical protein A5715_08400 [Mycolicibacter heraklionensis]OBI07763.1 hypothetical protein A5715_16960 [Mycolicibacter heraklionensis]OMC15417.1 hypothetical protein A5735_09375 [Mycolicibacter heraklionensis]ORW18893.1 hypothetical protein AWC18_15245 [Mycolicibacter nonchromogenicus]